MSNGEHALNPIISLLVRLWCCMCTVDQYVDCITDSGVCEDCFRACAHRGQTLKVRNKRPDICSSDFAKFSRSGVEFGLRTPDEDDLCRVTGGDGKGCRGGDRARTDAGEGNCVTDECEYRVDQTVIRGQYCAQVPLVTALRCSATKVAAIGSVLVV